MLDRLTSTRPLHSDCLQLAGLTALFVAAKQEEVEPPEVSDLVLLCDNGYEPRQFRWMEMVLLSHLEWRLQAPTAAFFLGHLVESEGLTSVWPKDLARRLLEVAMCDYQLMVAAPAPSQMAHAVFAIVASRLFR